MMKDNFFFPKLACGLVLLAATFHSARVRAEDDTSTAQDRLEEMKRQAAEYRATLAGSDQRNLVLHEEPLLRFSNPVGGVPDGFALMWKDGHRPAIFAQIFQIKDGQWVHEWQSIASAGLTLRSGETVKWQPAEAAGEFRAFPGGPPLASSSAKRLLQMRSLAARFTAADDFKISSADKETSRHELRLLPTPVYRYSDASAEVDEGAVFAFVHGTDPELFLVLENSGGDSSGWRYALTAMTCWAVEAKLDDRVVWSVPERLGKSTASDAYHVWIYRPQP